MSARNISQPQWLVGLALIAMTLCGGWAPDTLAAQYPTAAPPPLPMRPLRIPMIQDELTNGVQLLVVENHEVPLVSLQLGLPRGAAHDPPGQEGLADLISRVMIRGTSTRELAQLASEVTALGGALSTEAWVDHSTLSLSVPSDRVDGALGLIADIVKGASFPDAQVEHERTRLLEAIEAAGAQPAALSERFLAGALFGDHPYGRRATASSVRNIPVKAIRESGRSRLSPRGALLVASGDITIDRVRALAERHLSDWTTPSSSRPTQPEAPPVPLGTRVLLVHRRGATQSHVAVGHPAPAMTDSLHEARMILDHILGASDGRLTSVLRDEKRWTYGATTALTALARAGSYSISTEVRAELTSDLLTEIAGQLEQMRIEVLPDSTVAAAARYLAGAFPRDIETPEQIAGRLVKTRFAGLPPDHLVRYRERLASVTPGRVLSAAADLFDPARTAIVVVGDGEKLYDDLALMGPVSIVDSDGTPIAFDDLHPKPTPLALDGNQFAARRDSFVAIVQGNALGTMVSELVRGGDSIVYRERTSIPMANWSLETTVRVDASTLELRSVDQAGRMSGQTVDLHVELRDGRAIGHATSPQPGGTPRLLELDTTVVAGTIEVNALTALVPALALDQDVAYSVHGLNASTGAISPVTVTVTATGNLGVPAGLFPVYRVEISGGPAPLALYITRDTPRRIVKIERLGQPFSFELVN